MAPFTGRHTARNPAARPRPFFPSRFQQLKEVARETDRGGGGVFTPQERALTLLAQPPQSTERGRSVNSRLLVGGCLAVWSVALIAGQSGPSTPSPKPAATPAAQAKPAPQPRTVTVATSPAGLDQAAARKLRRSVLRHLPQRAHEDRRPAARTVPAGPRALRRPRRNGRTNRPQASRRPDAADRHARVRMPATLESLIRWMENELDREGRHASAGARPPPPEPHRVHERDSRSAGARSGRHEVPARRTTRRAASTTSPAR